MEYALRYHRRRWWVTPTSGKAPVLGDWPNRHLDEDGIREHFRPGLGIGVILGRSGLADLDFDDIKAVRAYGIIAPPELGGAAVFKHGDRPHIIVKAQDVETRRFKRADGSTLLEIRGDGAQTVFPPSVHRDGQPYVWLNDCDPPQVDAARLHVIALMTATAATRPSPGRPVRGTTSPWPWQASSLVGSTKLKS